MKTLFVLLFTTTAFAGLPVIQPGYYVSAHCKIIIYQRDPLSVLDLDAHSDVKSPVSAWGGLAYDPVRGAYLDPVVYAGHGPGPARMTVIEQSENSIALKYGDRTTGHESAVDFTVDAKGFLKSFNSRRYVPDSDDDFAKKSISSEIECVDLVRTTKP